MDFSHVIILSAVEGVTEFLPISSTAHLILTSHILGIPKSEFLSTFEVSIQAGAIAAVVFVYGKRIINDKKLFTKALIGFLPTGVLGVVLYKGIKALLSDPTVPVIALLIGGFAIIGIEFYLNRTKAGEQKTKNLSDLTYKDALVIGLIQSLSMIPGVSRSAASIFGAMAIKFDRKSAVEFAFLLAIPTMATATGFELIKTGSSYSSNQLLLLLLGLIGSFISALISIRWLIKYVQNNNFIAFGLYRIALSIIYYILFLR